MILRHFAVDSSNLQRIGIAAGGEGERVEEPVSGLLHVFPHKVLGHVTIPAGGNVPVAGLEPGVEVLLHDMAVGTGRRIAGQIGGAFGIHERVRPQAQGYPTDYRNGYRPDPGPHTLALGDNSKLIAPGGS